MEKSGSSSSSSSSSSIIDLNLEATELRLALPGSLSLQSNKRSSSEMDNNSSDSLRPAAKAQVVGWPPVRSYRKNALKKQDNESAAFVKVSMDGAPYLRKIDIKGYKTYQELLEALEIMFKCSSFGDYSETEGYDGSDLVPTYEDKDGDWMLVGDVPMDMFVTSCKRLRLMKAEA